MDGALLFRFAFVEGVLRRRERGLFQVKQVLLVVVVGSACAGPRA